jgi:hypothetical protein
MRRLLTRTATALLLGVAINVGFAWGIALLGTPRGRPKVNAAEYDRTTDMTWMATVHECRGFLLILSCHHRGRVDETLRSGPRLCSTVVPRIGDLHDWPTLDCEIEMRHRFTVGTGWPLPALWCAYQGSETAPAERAIWDPLGGGVDLGSYRRFPNGLRQRRVLPLRPLWSGFTVNTLTFAACLWPILLIAGAVRHRLTRLKRGCCPDCNHPVGGLSTCGSCGRPLPVAGSLRSERTPTGRGLGAISRHPRRLARFALIALALAVVTNAAVSWACVCCPTGEWRPMWWRASGNEEFLAEWAAQRPSFIPDAEAHVGGERRFGVYWLEGQAECHRFRTRADTASSARFFVWDEGRWVPDHDAGPRAQYLKHRWYRWRLVVAGWPWPAFRGSTWSLGSTKYSMNPKPPLEAGRRGLVEVRLRDRICEVPVLPVWRGFGLNTLMFWAVYAALLGISVSVRLTVRRRGGRCPRCGYPAGNEPTCAECGEVLPAFDVPSTCPYVTSRSAQ